MASMSFPQVSSDDGRVHLQVGPRRASLRIEGRRAAGFDVKHVETLSAAAAEDMEGLDPGRWLVTFCGSSPRARKTLQRLGLSYASATGEVYIHAPPVHVELPG